MSSLLITSADPESLKVLTEISEAAQIRARAVGSVENARHWLKLQPFDVLLVDSRYGLGIPVELFQLAWKQNPFTVVGAFNLYGAIEDEWSIRYAGARVFPEPNAKSALHSFLTQLPTPGVNDGTYGVLLVEDLDSPRDIIGTYVESLGFGSVHGTSSVDSALQVLRANPNKFFCVVTDLNMPERDGVSLIKEIRSDEQLSLLPVIVLTAYATGDKLISSLSAGATGFIVKPPQKRQLSAELSKAKRIFLSKQSPRLCRPEDTNLIEAALGKLTTL